MITFRSYEAKGRVRTVKEERVIHIFKTYREKLKMLTK